MEKEITRPEPAARLLFIDNIRWLMIVFVVVMHLNVTYSGLGSWFYKEEAAVDALSYVIFALYGSLTQAYFMGLLFFIAGYFAVLSYDKKGFTPFVNDRLFRLGIPTLIFMLILNPGIEVIRAYFYHAALSNFGERYLKYITSFDFVGGSGPLWFALALLVFSCVYGLIRLAGHIFENPQRADSSGSIRHVQIAGVVIFMSLVTFVTRLVQPIGTSVLNMQLCYFPQYIILFILGILAFRRGMLWLLPYKTGITWFKLALLAGIPFWFGMLILGDAFESLTPFWGGLYWQAAAYTAWESFFCVGISLGILVIFRDRFNTQNGLTRFLSQNAFAVYVLHPPILVALSLTLRGFMVYPLLKMILVTIIALPLCFGIGYMVRKTPYLRRILS